MFRNIVVAAVALVSAMPPATARMGVGAYEFHARDSSPFRYRAEVGEDSGCCVGSLTIYATDKRQRRTAKVFYAETFLLSKIIATKRGISVIGQTSDSEAWAMRNASTYDPYLVYEITGLAQARYDLKRSKAYTERLYCPWRGPKYNDNFATVMMRDGVCRSMTHQEFDRYKAAHPQRFR